MKIENKAYYDQFARTYEDRRHDGYHLLIDDLESGLVAPHTHGRSVLEIGCGTGLILNRIATTAERAVGIDLSPGMLEVARSRNLEVYEAPATELPFDDETFDVTYSFKVLSHVQELPTALQEISRVTATGGRLFLEFYNRKSLRYLARRIRGGEDIGSGIHDNQVYVQFYSLGELKEMLPLDLTLVRIHGVRIFTTFPKLLSVPVAGRGLAWAERYFTSTLLGRFGGFLILECVKSKR